jgi:hypothetical protein
MNETRTYTFDWRRREHAHVTSLLIREQFSSGVWRVFKWVVIVVLLVAATVAIASALLGDLASAMLLAPWLIVAAALFFAFGRLTAGIHTWRVHRHDPNVAHPLTHTLDESGIHISMHTVSFDLKWGGLHHVRETPDLFMFYYNKRVAYYLPKRALSGPEEIDALGAWIRAQLPGNVSYVKS